jgi:hypothetical protein
MQIVADYSNKKIAKNKANKRPMSKYRPHESAGHDDPALWRDVGVQAATGSSAFDSCSGHQRSASAGLFCWMGRILFDGTQIKQIDADCRKLFQ